MSVYLALPSARPPEEALPVLREWQQRGYRVVVQRDLGAPSLDGILCAYREYAGYPEAVNYLCRQIIAQDPQAIWIVAAGDDTLPDPRHSAEEIGFECSRHFYQIALESATSQEINADLWGCGRNLTTFGVMQPTGDDWSDRQGRIIERIAGSPWIGREFARRMYGGRGPLCEEYWHMFEDEELMAVAQHYGVFWQRPDLVHHHQHWGRPREGERLGQRDRMPAFLERANSPEEWQRSKAIFEQRKAAGWPGSEPIP